MHNDMFYIMEASLSILKMFVLKLAVMCVSMVEVPQSLLSQFVGPRISKKKKKNHFEILV